MAMAFLPDLFWGGLQLAVIVAGPISLLVQLVILHELREIRREIGFANDLRLEGTQGNETRVSNGPDPLPNRPKGRRR